MYDYAAKQSFAMDRFLNRKIARHPLGTKARLCSSQWRTTCPIEFQNLPADRQAYKSVTQQ